MKRILLVTTLTLLSICTSFAQSIELTPSGYEGTQNSSGSSTPSLKLLHPLTTGFSRINFENLGVSNKFMISGNLNTNASNSRWNVWHTSTGNIISASGDGNVGIGISSPIDKFHVKGGDVLFEDTTPFLEFRNTGDAGSNGIRYSNSTGSTRGSITYTPTSSTDGYIKLTEGSSTTDGIYLKNGRVGLNEDEPEGIFHIRGNSVPATPHLRFYENNNALADNITFQNFSSSEEWHIKVKAHDTDALAEFKINASNTGDVVTYTGNGNAKNHGFTQLGDSAPKVKMKKLSGTTANSVTSNILHGLTASKILAVEVLIQSGFNSAYYPPNSLSSATHNYTFRIGTTTVELNDVGANLQNAPYTLLITYEE